MILLDTNILSVWLYRASPEWSKIDAFISRLGSITLAASEVTRGEIEYGLELGSLTDAQKTQTRTEVAKIPLWFPIDNEVARAYGVVRASLFGRYSPRDARGRIRAKRVELLPVPPVTGADLQLEENDLWIVSTAIALDVPLATREEGISRIIEEAQKVIAYTHELVIP